jgi:hypothetical protein
MKLIPLSAFCLFLTSCSVNSSPTDAETRSEDSVTVAETDSVALDNGENYTEKNSDSLTLVIQQGIAHTALELGPMHNSYYTITARYSGYEYGADATWYFDSLLNLTYGEVSWSSDAGEGEYKYFFENDDLLAGTEENSDHSSVEKVFIHKRSKPYYGVSKTYGAEGDSTATFIYEPSYTSKNSSVKHDYAKLLTRLQQYRDSVSVGLDDVTLHIENVVNYGEDFTETEDYNISKILFDKLIREL